jgi:selenide,water dikinase
LAQVLQPFANFYQQVDYPDLITGLEQPDDAAVWKLDDNRALVVTTDFFTPVVDDPYDYGSIAAANSLSDVYAMGAKPFLALNIAAFPNDLPKEMVSEILRGGMEKAREAGVVIAGGHTIQDKEPKYGLIALGFAHPEKLLVKGGLRDGDVLLLSKPLGTGVITTALKRGIAQIQHLQSAVASMQKLNADAGALALELNAHGATDITGFGLLGHAWEMAEASGYGIEFNLEAIPLLPGAEEYAKIGAFAGGAFDNQGFYSPHVDFDHIPEYMQMMLFDPQTSGGLLVAVDEGTLENFNPESKVNEIFTEIGRVVPGEKILVR